MCKNSSGSYVEFDSTGHYAKYLIYNPNAGARHTLFKWHNTRLVLRRVSTDSMVLTLGASLVKDMISPILLQGFKMLLCHLNMNMSAYLKSLLELCSLIFDKQETGAANLKVYRLAIVS